MFPTVISNTGELRAGITLDSIDMSTGHYRSKYHTESLQQDPPHSRVTDREIERLHSDLQTSLEISRKETKQRYSVEEQLRETQEENTKLQQSLDKNNRMLSDFKRELEEKKKELQKAQEHQQSLYENNRMLYDNRRESEEKEAELRRQLQQKEEALQKLQERCQQLQQRCKQLQEEVRASQELHEVRNQWLIIDEKEVEMTDEELGKGSYGLVKVGIFRGLKVAVKSLHEKIASEYNESHFKREMGIASLLHHPNLVQFIGAKIGRNPLILTELMTTSLYKERKRCRLSKPQILDIAIQVALALNYLHLQKPRPLIHRDISSPNVLLDPKGAGLFKAKVSDYGSFVLAQESCTVLPGNPRYSAKEARDPEKHSPAMDVYSYCMLVMEMTIDEMPESTIAERKKQISCVTWTPMKILIKNGTKDDFENRPSMAEILDHLNCTLERRL